MRDRSLRRFRQRGVDQINTPSWALNADRLGSNSAEQRGYYNDGGCREPYFFSATRIASNAARRGHKSHCQNHARKAIVSVPKW